MSERRLSEIAKVLRQPEGIVGSEFTRINKAARKAGIRFDLWQQGFLWLLFAKNAEGKYACGADGAVLSSCRQIGKTFTVGTALFLKAILTPNLKAIWTAHHTRTSDETFADMCEMEHNPVLGRYVERIRRANGQQEITFTSGSRIMFGRPRKRLRPRIAQRGRGCVRRSADSHSARDGQYDSGFEHES